MLLSKKNFDFWKQSKLYSEKDLSNLNFLKSLDDYLNLLSYKTKTEFEGLVFTVHGNEQLLNSLKSSQEKSDLKNVHNLLFENYRENLKKAIESQTEDTQMFVICKGFRDSFLNIREKLNKLKKEEGQKIVQETVETSQTINEILDKIQ